MMRMLVLYLAYYYLKKQHIIYPKYRPSKLKKKDLNLPGNPYAPADAGSAVLECFLVYCCQSEAVLLADLDKRSFL